MRPDGGAPEGSPGHGPRREPGSGATARGDGPAAGGDGPARWRAAAAALLLLAAGAAAGVAVDRAWIRGGPGAAAPGPLTAEALARELDLGPEGARRIRRLVDSLDARIAAAAASGPDSLRAAARAARAELERALPAGAVPRFRAWMRRHHRSMMDRMHPDGRPGAPGPGMRPGRGTEGGRHMGPGGGTGRHDSMAGPGMMGPGGDTPRR